jgi:hypothetical protein
MLKDKLALVVQEFWIIDGWKSIDGQCKEACFSTRQ